ncbi:MAG: hypothetical protein VKJ06_09500 [Vampirovibrionales bacterium]|nr:hypothetical protein [Vampirovibrionales bacterium]
MANLSHLPLTSILVPRKPQNSSTTHPKGTNLVTAYKNMMPGRKYSPTQQASLAAIKAHYSPQVLETATDKKQTKRNAGLAVLERFAEQWPKLDALGQRIKETMAKMNARMKLDQVN